MINKKTPHYYNDSVIEVKQNSVIIKKEINLPEGKTTTRGDYPKLEEKDNCAYPERDSCNYGEFFFRCEYMKCKNLGNWTCKFKNAKKITDSNNS